MLRRYYKKIGEWIRENDRVLVFVLTVIFYDACSLPLTILIKAYEMTIGCFFMAFFVGLTVLTVYDIWEGFRHGTE